MFSVAVGKNFAPFENCGIQKISVCIDPELALDAYISLLPACAIERYVAKAVTTQNCYAADVLFIGH